MFNDRPLINAFWYIFLFIVFLFAFNSTVIAVVLEAAFIAINTVYEKNRK